MKISMRFLVFLLTLVSLNTFAQGVAPPPLTARAWLLIDPASGQTLAAQNPEQKIEPASLTKIMTSYVVYGALRDGKLKLDQVVPVSEKAWKAPGSRMFIAPDQQVTVDALLSGMVIQSGNDASTALAEAVAGSEEAFANRMNAEAQRLGLTNTHFVNATGLPDPAHMTTVADLARLTSALIRDFPEEYKRYAVKDYTWNKIRQPNRNRLLWLDPAVDGVKTGHTDSAGYCLIASRHDGARRLTAVVAGTASDDARTQEALTLLHYGAHTFDAVKVYDAGQPVAQLRLFKGSANTVAVGFATPLILSLPQGVAKDVARLGVAVRAERRPLLAPVGQGERLATLQLSLDGKPVGDFPLVALAAVPEAGLLGRSWDALKLLLQ